MNFLGVEWTQAYLHLLLNHFPITGLLVAWLILFGAALFKQRSGVSVALWAIILCAGLAYPVMETGERAAGKMYDGLDKQEQHWLHQHGERAEKVSKACYVLAGLALLGLGVRALNPKTDNVVAWLLVMLTAVCLAGTVWVGEAGGKIRHTEFRPVVVEQVPVKQVPAK